MAEGGEEKPTVVYAAAAANLGIAVARFVAAAFTGGAMEEDDLAQQGGSAPGQHVDLAG